MVFAMALALAGLNPKDFCGLIAKLTPDNKLSSIIERPISPSIRSESSGIGTLASSIRSSEGSSSPWPTPSSSRTPSVQSSDGNTPSLTPISSRPSTPTDEISKNEIETCTWLLDEPKKRDFLNLEANLKDPRWQIVHPTMPRHDFQSYLTNQSVYQRLDDKGLTEDYPMRCCKDCNFAQPSPYLFGEQYVQKAAPGNATKR